MICRTMASQRTKAESSQVSSNSAHSIRQKTPDCLSACDILRSCRESRFKDRFHGSPTKLFEYTAVVRAVVASRIGQIQGGIR